jgi:hypothetical protein
VRGGGHRRGALLDLAHDGMQRRSGPASVCPRSPSARPSGIPPR